MDEIVKVRQEMREDKWTSEKNTDMMMLSALFSSSGSQIKGIIEILNLLALVSPSKAVMAKKVANEIVTIQKEKGHLNLVDFSVTLKPILHSDFDKSLCSLLENCRNFFGVVPEEVRFEPAVLEELDGTFDSQFSSSLCLTAPVPVSTSSAVNAPLNSREQMLQRVEKTNPSFAAKLQKFSE